MKYKYKVRPYRHQRDALLKLCSTGFGGALLMAPRTGKTKTAIDYWCVMHEAGYVNRVLITCPVAVMGVWEDEINANVPDRINYTITVWDKDGRKEVGLPKWGKDRLDFVIINHDAFSTAGRITGKRKDGSIKRSRKRGGRYEMKREFNLWQPQGVAIDESHRFKSVTAAKHRTMLSLVWNKDGTPKIPYRLLMTGTPITKKKRVFDIYAQWKLLNPKRFRDMSFDEFKHHYGKWLKMDGYERWLRNDEKEVEKLREQIHKDSFAVTRDECFDLPHMTHQEVPVVLSDKTALVYDQMAEEMVAMLESGEITEASIKLVQTMRLCQISSGVARTKPTIAELRKWKEDGADENKFPKGKLVRIGTEKSEALESILDDLFAADEKVVVAARFIADIEEVKRVCKKLKVDCFVIMGKKHDRLQTKSNRDKWIKQFRAHSGPACFVVQPASGSMGIDLSTASTLIWYSLTPSWVDYTQMNDRIALNPHSVSIMYLLASGADRLLLETLKEDGDVARKVTESPERLLRNYKAK